MQVKYELKEFTPESVNLSYGQRFRYVDVVTTSQEGIVTTQTLVLPELDAEHLDQRMMDYSDPQKRIDELTHHRNLLGQSIGDYLINIGMINPTTPLDGPQLLFFLSEAKDYVKSLVERNWVDVSERLPEPYLEVPVITTSGTRRVARLDNNGKWQLANFVGSKHQYIVEVTKWYDVQYTTTSVM